MNLVQKLNFQYCCHIITTLTVIREVSPVPVTFFQIPPLKWKVHWLSASLLLTDDTTRILKNTTQIPIVLNHYLASRLHLNIWVFE